LTIDERLEKLAERHEALAQTVEIITGMQKETEKQLQQTGQNIERLAEVFADEHKKLDEWIRRNPAPPQ
jgi:hypothetical protein